jgi:hypothetical protein
MNGQILVPRIVGDKLNFYNATAGGMVRSVSLPAGGTYDGPIVSGDVVAVTVTRPSTRPTIYTYKLSTGTLIGANSI